MSVDLVLKNHKEVFIDAYAQAKRSIKVISPFIEKNAVDGLLSEIKKKNLQGKLITKFSTEDFICGVNNLDSLQNLLDYGFEIAAINSLHSKLYLFDDSVAIVGSANFTSAGLSKNIELSVKFDGNDNMIPLLNKYFDELYQKCNKVTPEIIAKEKQEVEKNKGLITEQSKIRDSHCCKRFNFPLTGVLKFEYDNEERQRQDGKYKLNKYKNFYFTCTPYNQQKPRTPRMLSADKLLFLTVLTKDAKGNSIPRIVGRAKTYGFKEGNIADAEMKKEFNGWLEHFAYYVEMYNIEVIKGRVEEEGISLLDVAKKVHLPNWRQASYRQLDDEATKYINELLDKKTLELYNPS